MPGNEPIEIGQLLFEAIADSFYAVKRDAAHVGQTGDGSGFHVYKAGLVGGGESALFLLVGDFGTGRKP